MTTSAHRASGEPTRQGGSPERVPLDAPPAPPVAELVFGDRLPLAQAYVAELATTGVTHGLLGPREVPRLWDRHVLNCAVLGDLVPRDAHVVDVGSGAGLPGLALAIARPDLRIDLVEPMLRRTTWLEDVIGRLGLTGVTVTRARAEQVAGRLHAPVVTSRAVARIGQLAVWSVPLVEAGGMVLALKGVSAADELTEDAALVREAGIVDAEVVQCGGDALETPTTVIRAFVADDHRPGPTPLLARPRQGKRRSGPGTREVSRETPRRRGGRTG